MDISLTKAEYRLLLDMIYIASWIMTAHKTDVDTRTLPYEDLEQKLYSRAEEEGFGYLIEYMAKFDRYFPLSELEEDGLSRRFIDEFENDSFWEELISRLAERDVIKQLGSSVKFEQLAPLERIQMLGDREDFYNEEFAAYGLKRLKLVRPRAKRRGRIRPS